MRRNVRLFASKEKGKRWTSYKEKKGEERGVRSEMKEIKKGEKKD